MTTTGSHGNFVWFELLTTDPKAAADFYSKVIGWTTQPFEMDVPYTMFVGPQGPLGGTTALSELGRKSGASAHWIGNVYVDDVDASCALVRKLGGRVLAEPLEFAKIGRLAVIADPQGGTMHLFKPKDQMALHDPSKAGAVNWSELLTTDHESAFSFYSQLFGWKKVRDFDMGPAGKYLVYSHRSDSREMGGMFTKTPDMPMGPTWFYYVHVDQIEAAVERVKANGGQLMNGPMDVPGGGRIAQVIDPQGAMFAFHQDFPAK